jgi:chromosome partitioning protein
MKAVPGLPGSYVVPSDISVSAAELSLGGLPYREWRLVHALSPLRRQFDLVVFDAAPTVSLINLNAILASDDLIIPVLAETLSVHSLTSLMKTLASIEADFGHPLGNAAVLLNRFVPSDPRCMEMRNHLRASCEGRCLRTVVRYCADLSHQPMERRLGSRLKLEGEVLADIQSLADEIAPRKEPRRRAEEGDGTL